MATYNASPIICVAEKTCKLLAPRTTYQRHLLDLEKNFDVCGTFTWFTEIWKIIYVFISLYLMAIFAGQHYMKSRPPFRLRGALFAWNLALAVFSIFCAWRTVTAVLYEIEQLGFHESVCGSSSKEYSHAVGIYVYLFALSKIVELGDTAFIVLRKTPLIFLHWFHHATVCFFVWSGSAYPSNIQCYFMAMNYLVHSFMYSYYTLKVLRVPIPKPVGMAITSLQLFQMVGGVIITSYTNYMKTTLDVGCCVHDEALTIAASIYLAYFVLFLNFFVRSYVFKKSKPAAMKSD